MVAHHDLDSNQDSHGCVPSAFAIELSHYHYSIHLTTELSSYLRH